MILELHDDDDIDAPWDENEKVLSDLDDATRQFLWGHYQVLGKNN